WNNSTSWASSAFDEAGGRVPAERRGLTAFGRKVVQRMNALGMIVDLSHVGEQTFSDVLQVATRPVIASHSCVYALNPVPRNLKDEQIKAIARTGGVVQLNFYAGFLDPSFHLAEQAYNLEKAQRLAETEKSGGMTSAERNRLEYTYDSLLQAQRPSLAVLLDHLDYIVRLVGVDHAGLGSDFDGITYAPRELNSVADFPLITRGLKKRGYSRKDIKKDPGGKFYPGLPGQYRSIWGFAGWQATGVMLEINESAA
ncbi:MAG TPA: membrane dipeptidase, partial [Chitinophagaceae bacterium]|nr:membrane dipeptidase [Chitinophagaceae bacterium]